MNTSLLAAAACSLATLVSADPLDQWTARSASTNTQLNAVTWGDGAFVAAGGNGTIVPSGELPVLSIVASDAVAAEPGPDTGTLTVSRTGGTREALTVNYTVNGGALPGVDYLALPGTVTIPAGQTTASLRVTPLDDRTQEEMEFMRLRLVPAAGFIVGTPGSATVTINDDEPPAPMDLDHWILRNPLPLAEGLGKVAFANNLFLAMQWSYDPLSPDPDFETLWTSADGTNWTGRWIARGYPLASVTYGGGTYVAVGSKGRIATSPDASVWTEQNSGSTNLWLSSVAYGAGTFVAVGESGVVLTSPDGIVWTPRITDSTQTLYAITYAQGLFVAVGGYASRVVGGGVILTSPDGAIWTERYRSVDIIHNLFGVTFGNGTFVVEGNGSKGAVILTSFDGVNWTRQNPPASHWDWDSEISFGNGFFVLQGELAELASGSVRTFVSSNGVTWIEHARDASVQSVAFGNGLFVGVNYYLPFVQTAADGVHWSPQGSDLTAPDVVGASTSHLNAVAYGNGMFVAVGNYLGFNGLEFGCVVASPDGATWTRQQGGTDIDASLIGITYGDGKFVAVGGQRILTSPDASSWWSSEYIEADLADVTYGDGTFVAVGSGGTIVTSPDGTNWTTQNVDATVSGVGYGAGRFVAVGSHTLTSTDGYAWTRWNVDIPCASPASVAYGNGVFVAVGKVQCSKGQLPLVMISPDGGTWTMQDVPGTEPLSHVAFGNGIFTAVGRFCFRGCSGGSIVTSPDGVTWTLRLDPPPSGAWALGGITYGNGSFIAVGWEGTILQSGWPVQFLPAASARLGDGTMRLALDAEMGAELLLEASTDLVNWGRLATLTNTLGRASVLDLAATNFPRRFYRARQISR